MVGAGTGQQVIRDATRQLKRLAPQPARQRGRAAHHVALHVAAGAEGRDQRIVQAADRALEIALQHAVELVVLPRGDPQGAVAVAPGQVVEHEILIGREDAARDLAADHERVLGFSVAAAAPASRVAVLLLVDPVEFQELRALLREVVRLPGELGSEWPAQAATLLLDLLDGTQRSCPVRHRHPFPDEPSLRDRLLDSCGQRGLRHDSLSIPARASTWVTKETGPASLLGKRARRCAWRVVYDLHDGRPKPGDNAPQPRPLPGERAQVHRHGMRQAAERCIMERGLPMILPDSIPHRDSSGQPPPGWLRPPGAWGWRRPEAPALSRGRPRPAQA